MFYCFAAAVIAIIASVMIVWLLIGMQRNTPDKGIFKSFDDILDACRKTKTPFEVFLLVLVLIFTLKKKGTIGLAAIIIPAMGVFVSAVCGQDWLGILNALPTVVKGIRDALR